MSPAVKLDFEVMSEVKLQTALYGLPDPLAADNGNSSVMSGAVKVESAVAGRRNVESFFLEWISGARPKAWAPRVPPGHADAHVCRPSREDDAALFRLMGPGTRWMDYRCDKSDTLNELQWLVSDLIGKLENRANSGRDSEAADLLSRLKDVQGKLDGSLSIRLLLEGIAPQDGELEHHLLTDTYLGKKDGSHGDWIMRLAADEPSKTIVAHMGKDTYSYVHPWSKRMLSVREAARIQTFPDWFSFGNQSMVDAFRIIGNAVPPLLSAQLAGRVAHLLWLASAGRGVQRSVQPPSKTALPASGTRFQEVAEGRTR